MVRRFLRQRRAPTDPAQYAPSLPAHRSRARTLTRSTTGVWSNIGKKSPRRQVLLSQSQLTLLFRVKWQSCFFPRLKTAEKWMDILESMSRKFLRHTGARGFVWSSAVTNNRSIARDFSKVLLDLLGRHAYRAGQFGLRFAPGLRITRVNKSKLLSAIQPLCYFINRHSGCFHINLQSLALLRHSSKIK